MTAASQESSTATEPRSGKGLESGALGLWGNVTIGLASTAPAYSLAATLGPHRAALLRAHGVVVVADSVPRAVMIAIYMAENAAVALSCGAPHRAVPSLAEGEVAETARRLLTPATVARVWAGRLNRLPK